MGALVHACMSSCICIGFSIGIQNGDGLAASYGANLCLPTVSHYPPHRDPAAGINRNRYIALMSAITLRENPGETIVTDSCTSNGLATFIQQLGGKHFRFKKVWVWKGLWVVGRKQLLPWHPRFVAPCFFNPNCAMQGYKNIINKGVELNQAGVPSPLMMETSGHGAMRVRILAGAGSLPVLARFIAHPLLVTSRKITSWMTARTAR